jgi:Tfp pilus assembly protein PilF
MSARAETLPRGLVAGVLVLALVVIGLGGAVIALKLRPASLPTDSVNREIALWRETVQQHPDDARAHTGLGLAYAQAQEVDAAEAEFEKAISLDDTAWMAKFQLALLTKQDDPSGAAQLLTQAAKGAPQQERVAPLVALGDLQLAAHHAKGARDAYRKAIAYDPFSFDGHLGLAKALEALGERRDALEEYRQAKRFDPTNQDVAAAIARLGG